MEAQKLNWLRAGVLGANDGIISVSVILISVVGTLEFGKLFLVGLSAILGGALSMAIGEYISVSAQRDAERAALNANLTNPYHAAFSSFTSFVIGASIPAVAAFMSHNVFVIVVAVLLALILSTCVSAKIGKSKLKHQLLRNIVGGGFALTVGLVLNLSFT